MMKKIVLALIALALSAALNAQVIWCDGLGIPSESLLEVSWEGGDTTFDSVNAPEGSAGDAASTMNALLASAGITWVRVVSVEAPVSEGYEISLYVFENNNSYSRSVHFGVSGHELVLTQTAYGTYPQGQPSGGGTSGGDNLPDFFDYQYITTPPVIMLNPLGENRKRIEIDTVLNPDGSEHTIEGTDDVMFVYDDNIGQYLTSGSYPLWPSCFAVDIEYDEDNHKLVLYLTCEANSGSEDIVGKIGSFFKVIQEPIDFGLRFDPDSTMNYIGSVTYNSAGTNSGDIAYYNGLGYESQRSEVLASGNGRKDIVYRTGYDFMIRPDKSYLPYPVERGFGAYDSDGENAQTQYYRDKFNLSLGNECSWSETVYEDSSLDRVKEEKLPGVSYQETNHTTVLSEIRNASSDIPIIDVSFSSGLMRASSYYQAGSLIGKQVVDGDGRKRIDWIDKDGRTICKDGYVSSDTKARTLYGYDICGRLIWVITPEGSSRLSSSSQYEIDGEFANLYCYVYRYDGFGRTVEKRLPGADPVYFVYDLLDRIVMRQDGNMRSRREWQAWHYDSHGRNIKLALVNGRASRETLQSGFDAGTAPALYDRDSVILHQWYYDGDIPSGTSLSYQERPGITVSDGLSLRSTAVTGLLTGERINLLGTTSYSEKLYFYDGLGREIQTVQTLPTVGTLRTSSLLDLRGNILKREDINNDNVLLSEFTYDSRDRVLSERSTLNGNVTSGVDHTYDDLGRLSVDHYLTSGQDADLSTVYSYTLQGWLSSKNTDSTYGAQEWEQLHYGDNLPFSAATPSWTGKISTWCTDESEETGMVFSYDGLGRMTSGKELYLGDSSNWEENVGYDLNGNIQSLSRQQYEEEVYVKEFSYTGNHRQNCDYDRNGNVIYDDYRPDNDDSVIDIPDLRYNILNLPAVSYVGEYPVSFGYLADGTKVYVEGSEELYNKYRYAGPFRYYENDSERILESVAASGGRIAMSSDWMSGDMEGEMVPKYFITDHLGSVRMVVNDSGEVLQRNLYYPYGERMASWTPSLTNNDYLYGGKELHTLFSLPFYDSGARFQTTDGIFTSMDPLCEKYYSVSPYAYCSGDPVNYVDILGLSTQVYQSSGSTYVVTDQGNPYDGDNNIYVGYYNSNGEWIQTGVSIGMSMSPFSFYNTDHDKDNEPHWVCGAIINVNDKSGSQFLGNLASKPPFLINYILNARHGKRYDFKMTNGSENVIYEDEKGQYRGMLLGDNNGIAIYGSARDVGDLGAGYMAGIYGIPYILARLAFDIYQGRSEAIGTRFPEQLGWYQGYKKYTNAGYTETVY